MIKMTKYTIEVEVDEEMLRKYCGGPESVIGDLIHQEMGWVHDSGIYVVKIEEHE